MGRKGLLNRLLDLLHKSESAERNRPRATTGPSPEPTISSPQEFGERVGKIFAEQHPVVGGKIQLLNLRPLRERYQTRWTRLADMIHRTVVNVLKRRLSPQDVFSRNQDDTYVIVFANLGEDEARLKCALLAREIGEKLTGEAAPDSGLDVTMTVATLSGNVGLEASESLDQVTQVLDAASEPTIMKSNTESDPGPQSAIAFEDQLTNLIRSMEHQLATLPERMRHTDPIAVRDEIHRLSELLRRADADLDAIAQDPVPPLTPIAVRSPPQWIEDIKGRTQQTLIIADRIRSAVEPWTEATSAGSEDEARIEFFYRPVWQARRGVVTTYAASLRCVVGDHEIYNDSRAIEEDEITMASAMDRLVLRRTIRDLASGLQERRPTVVIVPVHYLTVSRPAISSDYIRLAHTVPEQARPFLVWEVLDAPVGAWGLQMFPILSRLKRLGRAIILRVGLEPQGLKEIATMGVHAVGLNLDHHQDLEVSLLRKIERFATLAEKAGLQSYINGVRSLSIANAAIAAGFDYLSGQTLARPVESPMGIVPTDLYDIYKRNLL